MYYGVKESADMPPHVVGAETPLLYARIISVPCRLLLIFLTRLFEGRKGSVLGLNAIKKCKARIVEGRGKKSLLLPESELRIQGREKKKVKIRQGIEKKQNVLFVAVAVAVVHT